MEFSETCPSSQDSFADLLRKWNKLLSVDEGGLHAPSQKDSEYDSILKILRLYNADAGLNC